MAEQYKELFICPPRAIAERFTPSCGCAVTRRTYIDAASSLRRRLTARTIQAKGNTGMTIAVGDKVPDVKVVKATAEGP
ncbi:hypothetical protein ACE4Z5_27020, partial [Salmonella enterica]|uniref:hypothetical protein n=1 Tax=Salmonella enterica TaxID=28901 RepID=UPI003D2DB10F